MAPHWNENDYWLSGVPISEWEGVATDNNGRVIGLSLNDNRLSGEIPPELGNLTNLRELSLGGNQLSGEIPPELSSLTSLETLWLVENQLSGEIPPELGNLANLIRLWLSGNQLSGEIPPWLGNLANLKILYLHGNQFSGEIPPWLGSLTNLSRLGLGRNQLSGEIPPELGNLANLTYLGLSGNQLSGEIPPELGSLADLAFLYLSENQLSGCVPSSLSRRLEYGIFRPGYTPVLPVRPLAHPACRRDKFSAERIVGESPCPQCAPQRPPPTGCRAMPFQARGLLERPSSRARQSRAVSTAISRKDRRLILLIPATGRTRPGCTSPTWCCCTTGTAT